VDDAVAVRVIDGVGHVLDEARDLLHLERRARAQSTRERPPLEVFHDDVGRADVVDLDDTGMIESPRGLGLVAEAGVELLSLLGRHELGFLQDLHGDRARQAGIHAEIDDAHGSRAQLFEHLIAAEIGGCGVLHGCAGVKRGHSTPASAFASNPGIALC
jgi:hypothetical protein